MVDRTSEDGRPARRRAPDGQRQRDPERTKEKILDAALEEFSEHGYAGARVATIARRAGVNQQLISYYFDGKAGLARALNERWREISAGISLAEAPLGDVVAGFVRQDARQRHWARLLVWQGLTGEEDDPQHDDFFDGIVAEVRRRQDAGEIADDLDPGHLSLLIYGAAVAPVALPQVARRLTGADPSSERFLDTYVAQIRLLLGKLAGP